MKRPTQRILSFLMMLMLLTSTLSACSGSNNVPSENQFKWWIFGNDGVGTHYEGYEGNPVVQWVNNQYWDTSNHTLGSEGNGQKIQLSFQTPIAGSESDNFNTMIGTGEYPEIIDLMLGNPRALYQDGIIMDITEYVNEYMPNYLAYLEQNPAIKPLVRDIDENGNEVYFALYGLYDNVRIPWQGHMYRRDWVVKYAEPTAYVWDWESDYVKQNGHPKITPLSAAESANDFTGWKTNEITEFTSSEGSDPSEDYTDNVIFPSGKDYPYTISDWEWMFKAFKIAIDERGFTDNPNAYVYSLFYQGHVATGELASCFGGGNGTYYIDKDGNIQYGATGENFKTYLETMNTWYNNGWIDTRFETRAADPFYEINPTGTNQGMVGMWHGMLGQAGDTLRATCVNEEDKKDAMSFGCPLPLNDMYGSNAKKFVAPDSLYQDPLVGFPTGFTSKCEGKNMEALFSFFNWRYSFDGALIGSIGLSEEQYKSMEFNPDVYADVGISSVYSMQESSDGIKQVSVSYPKGVNENALRGVRLAPGLGVVGDKDKGYVIDTGYDAIVQNAIDLWLSYRSTSAAREYDGLLSSEETNTKARITNYIDDFQNQSLPNFIKNGLSGWDDYVKKIEKFNPQQIIDIYERHIN